MSTVKKYKHIARIFKYLYLYFRHDYTENDVIDAIVYRKPVALKAVYYLIEKRLKLGLNFPDSDFNPLCNDNINENYTNLKITLKNHVSDISNINVDHLNNGNNNTITNNNINNNQNNNNMVNTNFQNVNNANSNGVIKYNSQLLPKRHGVQIATRSSSQKNVDFRSIFNNINLNNSNNRNLHSSTTNRDDTSTNINNSKSPSPDFIAAAMSPIKTATGAHSLNQGSTQLNSASSIRHSRQTNYQDIINPRKQSNVNNNTNINSNSNNNINNIKNSNEVLSRNSAISNGGETRMDHYYVQLQSNSNTIQPDENYQPVIYYQPSGGEIRLSAANNINAGATVVSNKNQIRSLPGSIYRGSPERSLPRSPDRATEYNNNLQVHRPTTSRATPSRPTTDVCNTHGEKIYDTSNQKFKVVNYLAAKRSLTSCEESAFDRKNPVINNGIIKTRQLQMGKAKIDLETQPSNYYYK